MNQNRRQGNELPADSWTSPQVYIFAALTLLLGLVVGFLLRGPAMPAASSQASAQSSSPVFASGFVQQPLNATAKVEPLLRDLQARPNDAALLTEIGNIYYDAQQYQPAIDYYQRALKLRPTDVNVRTDMGTAMWYLGKADEALQEYEQSLKYQPTHAQTLFNMGIVKWQGKKDGAGAVQVWDRLLASNPNYPDRQKVEQLIQQARSGA